MLGLCGMQMCATVSVQGCARWGGIGMQPRVAETRVFGLAFAASAELVRDTMVDNGGMLKQALFGVSLEGVLGGGNQYCI